MFLSKTNQEYVWGTTTLMFHITFTSVSLIYNCVCFEEIRRLPVIVFNIYI